MKASQAGALVRQVHSAAPARCAAADAPGAFTAGEELSERDFLRARALLRRHTGIALGPEKKALVASRLDKRLRALGIALGAYLDRIEHPDEALERQAAIDLLTTNETYFFREPSHSVRLQQWLQANDAPGRRWRAWSAAASTGQEAYSLAMVLADTVGLERFEVCATDVSTRVLERAVTGHYPCDRLEHVPAAYLKRFLLKGVGRQAGMLLVDRRLRGRTAFFHANLLQPQTALGTFDVIFLRNVLIYFDADTKRQVIGHVCAQLRTGGLFVVSHAETLTGLGVDMAPVAPGMYCKRA